MSELRETDSSGVERHLTRNGKLSYLQIPARDPAGLGAFYAAVFGWSISGGGDQVSFRDATGDLIGAFTADLEPADPPGYLPYIYVADIEAVVEAVVLHGGEVVDFPSDDGQLRLATIRDPDGNHVGLWQSLGE
ncbi:MAG: VOC family protein [Dehalococcoidia bacterium]